MPNPADKRRPNTGSKISVLVVGDVNMDRIYRCPPLKPGTEQFATVKSTLVAGSAGYFSMALAKLGRQAHLASCVGKDADGDAIRSTLRFHGVDTAMLFQIDSAPTGETLIFVDPEGRQERLMATFQGALKMFDHGAIAPSRIRKSVKLIHQTSYFVLDGMRKTVCDFFDLARAKGILISFDPNAGDLWQDTGIRGHLLNEVVPRTNLLFLNEDESLALTGKSTPQKALLCLAQTRPRLLINVKMGKRGVLVGKGGEFFHMEGFPPPGPVIDAVGAGDTYAATFVDAYLDKRPLVDCAAMACIHAASTLVYPGPLQGQKTRRELRQIFRRHKLFETRTASGMQTFSFHR